MAPELFQYSATLIARLIIHLLRGKTLKRPKNFSRNEQNISQNELQITVITAGVVQIRNTLQNKQKKSTKCNTQTLNEN